MTTNKTEAIRALNNTFRSTFIGGRVLLTPGVQALDEVNLNGLLTQVRTFDAFTPDNDPHGEHDFGSIDQGDVRYFWKIDYYAPDMQRHSDDPADAAITRRVLTIMRADEY